MRVRLMTDAVRGGDGEAPGVAAGSPAERAGDPPTRDRPSLGRRPPRNDGVAAAVPPRVEDGDVAAVAAAEGDRAVAGVERGVLGAAPGEPRAELAPRGGSAARVLWTAALASKRRLPRRADRFQSKLSHAG